MSCILTIIFLTQNGNLLHNSYQNSLNKENELHVTFPTPLLAQMKNKIAYSVVIKLKGLGGPNYAKLTH